MCVLFWALLHSLLLFKFLYIAPGIEICPNSLLYYMHAGIDVNSKTVIKVAVGSSKFSGTYAAIKSDE